jgi:prevent-host-death family protein
MSITSNDIIPLNQIRARFTELADRVVSQGDEKIITRNGESYVALIDAKKLDFYHKLEKSHLHLLLAQDVEQGLDDIANNNTTSLSSFRQKHQRD